eukprot:2189010-Rhodomonas_salina.1
MLLRLGQYTTQHLRQCARLRPRKTPCSPHSASLQCSTRSRPWKSVHLHPHGRNHNTSGCLFVWIS